MKRAVAVAAAMLVAGLAFSQDKPPAVAGQVCAACHSADGNSVAAANPNIAGQLADYITLQLAHFKAGLRVNATMQAMAAPLSDADMRALGAYFSQQEAKGLAARDPALVQTR